MKLPTLEQLLTLREQARFLSLDAHISAVGQLQGIHQSPHRGRGIEFSEVRPYAAGDDIRSIDWRVTARRGKLHTKLFHEDRERTVWILVDLDPAMFFGSRRQTKSAVAVWAAALLAWVASARGAHVGALLAGPAEPRVFAPRSRDAGALSLVRGLVELQPRRPAFTPASGFATALTTARRLVRPGSLVLAISDFATEASTSLHTWSQLSAHADCQLYWIVDPLEEQGLPNGRFRVHWGGATQTLDGASVRKAWHEAWDTRQKRITELAERCGLPVTRLNTSDAIVEALQSRLRISKAVA